MPDLNDDALAGFLDHLARRMVNATTGGPVPPDVEADATLLRDAARSLRRHHEQQMRSAAAREPVETMTTYRYADPAVQALHDAAHWITVESITEDEGPYEPVEVEQTEWALVTRSRWVHVPDGYDDDGMCPYYARYRGLSGADPAGSCDRGCTDEPACVTDEPAEGWPSVRFNLRGRS